MIGQLVPARWRDERKEGVLASWGDGHMIEWVAQRPTVATVFGSYLGQSSYRFGPRAFLSENDSELDAMLRERRIGYLLFNSNLPEMLPDLVQPADPQLTSRYLAGVKRGWSGGLRPAWFATAMARLLLAGASLEEQLPAVVRQPIPFLRLVHVAPEPSPKPLLGGLLPRWPRGWVWLHVPGAQLLLHGSSGSEVGVQFQVRFPDSELRVPFVVRTTVGETGVAVIQVPYCTDASNGDGRVVPGAEYCIGAVRAPLKVPEPAVLAVSAIELY